jgi:hypothetical protein
MPLPTFPINVDPKVEPKKESNLKKSQPVSLPLDVVVEEIENEEGWTVDQRTGIKHKIMPPTQIDENGNPVLQFEDFDSKNLNKEAQDFLGHLRVPANAKQ